MENPPKNKPFRHFGEGRKAKPDLHNTEHGETGCVPDHAPHDN
jgi:hypothetical protein